MPVDPVAAACQALVGHLTDELGDEVAAVKRGWPEHTDEYDLSQGPLVTVTASEPNETRMAPRQVDSSTSGSDVTVTYKVAELRFKVQVDLWTPYRAQLDELIPTVEACWDGEPPFRSGLWLEQSDDATTGYHGRPLAFEPRQGPLREPSDDTASTGEWRATWILECVTDKVAQRTFTSATRIDAQAEFSGGSSGTEIRTSTP